MATKSTNESGRSTLQPWGSYGAELWLQYLEVNYLT